MITVDLTDPNLIKNVNAIRELQKVGLYTEEELQRLYDRQTEMDKRKGEADD